MTWAPDSDQVEVQASTKPTYNLKCPTKPITVQSILRYLESNKQSNVSLANHQVKRQGDNSYQITQEDTCKYIVSAVGARTR